tara:strand:- start:2475 stop:4049 length:1575 start_codon:yes stop_codon:yes gene_type:complete
VIVLFFLVKGTYLAITVPLFDTADEMFHFDYVYQVYQGEGPPHIFDDSIHEDVFFGAKEAGHWVKEGYATPETLGLLTSDLLDSVTWWYKWDISGGRSYEGVQPPLYYLVSAGVLFVMPVETISSQVIAVRLVSVGLGMLLLVLTYFMGYGLSGSRFIGVCATAFVATLPAETMIGMRASNDVLGQLGVAALGAFLAWRTLNRPDGKFDTITVIGAGVLLGLAGLAKANAVPAGVIISVIFFFSGKGSLVSRIGSTSTVIGIAAIVCGWWYLRNYALYGDAIGGQALVRAIYVELPWVADTVWGAFSYHVDLVRELAFQPYLQFLPQNGYWIPKTVWLLGLSIVLLRLIEGSSVYIWNRVCIYVVSTGSRKFVRGIYLLRTIFKNRLPVSAVWIITFIIFSLLISKGVLEQHEVLVLGAGIIFVISRLQPLSRSIGKLELVCVSGLLPALLSGIYFTMQIGPSSERYLLNGVVLLAVLWAFSVQQIVQERYQIPFVLFTTGAFVAVDWVHKVNMLEVLSYRLGI